MKEDDSNLLSFKTKSNAEQPKEKILINRTTLERFRTMLRLSVELTELLLGEGGYDDKR